MAECRKASIEIMRAVIGRYGDGASSLACQLFDSVMQAEGVDVPPAQIYDGPREGAVIGTVHRTAGELVPNTAAGESFFDEMLRTAGDGRAATEAMERSFAESLGYHAEQETRRAASNTMEENVSRAQRTRTGKSVRFARVPTSGAPCKVCAMLAGHGFYYKSRESAMSVARLAGKLHYENCKCTIVPGVKGKTTVEGYDPDYYKDVWEHPERYKRAAVYGGNERGSHRVHGLVSSKEQELDIRRYLSGEYGMPEPMSFEKADSGRCNPHFGEPGYGSNCQTTVIVYELRRRGFDVEALPRTDSNKVMDRLGQYPLGAWTDPSTGSTLMGKDLMGFSREQLSAFIDNAVNAGERHVIGYSEPSFGAHIVNIERTQEGELLVYDPQRDELFVGGDAMTRFDGASRIDHFARVDNAVLDVGQASQILRMAGSV